MNSELLGPENGRVFRPFPGVLADAVAVRHPTTQVNVTHMGCIVFDDQTLHSFLTFLKLPSAGRMCIFERAQTPRLSLQNTALRFSSTLSRVSPVFSHRYL
jgi:hypothetical protein